MCMLKRCPEIYWKNTFKWYTDNSFWFLLQLAPNANWTVQMALHCACVHISHALEAAHMCEPKMIHWVQTLYYIWWCGHLTAINFVYDLRPCVLLKSTLCRWTLDEHDISWDRIEDVALYRNSDNTYFVENRAIDFTQFERQTKFIRCWIWFSECFVINLFKIFVGNEFDLLMHIEFVKNYFDYILMLEFQSFNRFLVKRCPPHHLNSHWYESVQLLPG